MAGTASGAPLLLEDHVWHRAAHAIYVAATAAAQCSGSLLTAQPVCHARRCTPVLSETAVVSSGSYARYPTPEGLMPCAEATVLFNDEVNVRLCVCMCCRPAPKVHLHEISVRLPACKLPACELRFPRISTQPCAPPCRSSTGA